MWHKAALSIELQRRTIYGLDFWIKMLVPPIIQMVVAYYLWDAVYASQGVQEIGGYTFAHMMMYYVVASMVYQMVQPEVGIVLRDIYDGTLTKYLFYPLNFFQFKFITHVAQMLIVALQLLVALLVFVAIFGIDALGSVTIGSFVRGIMVCFFSGYLFFIFAAFFEVVGFWVETVWGLVLMLQFVTNLLGGKLLPLSVFPLWLQEVLAWTPFPYMVSFPTKVMLNQLSLREMIVSFLATLLWCLIIQGAARFLWQRGSYNYSGTGM